MNTERLESSYEFLLSKYPKGQCSQLGEHADQRLLAMDLPKELIYIWQKYGICGYGRGLWWHTNPDKYHEVVELWLRGPKFWQPKTNPITPQ